MKTALLFAAIMLIALIAFLTATKRKAGDSSAKEKPKKRRLLTEREQAMFNRLGGALPDMHVLTQVSFGALLTAKGRPVRNTFDRKIADFVVCNKAMQVIAVIELDDASHRSKEEADNARDALLKGAGYRVLRYRNIPDINQIQRDFTQPIQPTGAPNANHNEPAGTSPIDAAGTVLARETEPEQKRVAQRTSERAH